MEIRVAQASDFDAVVRLLQLAELVTDDLDDNLNNFVVGIKDQQVCGAGGLEVLGMIALLRSVVVAEQMRGEKSGSKIVTALLHMAAQLGLHQLFLLTNSAERFFNQYGFVIIDRNAAPPAITNTAQFSDLCPDTAQLMSLRLE